MAKNTTLTQGDPAGDGGQGDPIETKPVVPKPAVPVYTFRIKGTSRTYDVDAAHLNGMRSRADAEYIGTIPLPTRLKTNAKPTS